MAVAGLLTGSGWLLFALTAGEKMARSDFALVLTVLVLGEILGHFLVIGWTPSRADNHTLTPNWAQGLAAILMRWVLLVGALGLVAATGTVPLLDGQPVAGLYLAGSSLCLALSRLAVAQRSHAATLFAARLVMGAGLVWGLAQISELDPSLLLSALLLGWLVLTVAVMRGQPTPFNDDIGQKREGRLRETLLALGPALLAAADVLIIFCLFSPATAAGYLMLRAGGQAVVMALHPVQIGASARLWTNETSGLPKAFAADAARVNLGLLLIGGGASVGILALQGMFSAEFGVLDRANRPVLMWILLGAAAPAFFGAGPLYLSIIGRRREWALISFLSALLMGGLAFGLRISTPLGLAQVYATVQLAAAALAAGIIGHQRGVWPGLTALLFRRIRLV